MGPLTVRWQSTCRGGGAPTEGPEAVGNRRRSIPARVEETLVWPVDEDEVGVPFAGTAVRQGVARSAVAPGLH